MKLYTWENCPKCDEAKGIIANKGIEVEIIEYDATKREHRDLRIMWVPTLDADTRYVGQDVINFLNNL
jgi:arsenate reductase-like glutaredoxin family protein